MKGHTPTDVFARFFLALFLGCLAFVAPGIAYAQINNPPLPPQDITVFPERDFVSIDGLMPNADLLIQVRRPTATPVVVSTAQGRTNAQGFLEVNHPGGVCWIGVTPDIKHGDQVRVTYRNTPYNLALPAPPAGSGAQTVTSNVTAQQAYDDGAGNVVIKGRAQLATGNRIPLGRLEVRIINPEFRGTASSRITRRDIRADSAGGRVDGVPGGIGMLTYDAGAGNINFTAVFSGLNDSERLLATEGQTRAMAWQQTDAAGNRLGMTIFEVGEVGGPGFGGCPDGPGGPVASVPPAAPVTYNPANLLDAANPADQASINPNVIVFPQRDFVSIEGFPAGTDLQVVIRGRRNNVAGIVGTARGIVDRNGLFEVNHPGGVCWSGQTPDILPGDILDVFSVVNGAFFNGQTQRVIDIDITRTAFVTATGELRVNGSARNADGTPFPLDRIEQRIINPDFIDTRIARRDIRADIAGGRVGDVPGGTGNLLRTGTATSNAWRAIYNGPLNGGMTSLEQTLAIAGENRAMAWLSTNANGDRFGITIYEAGLTGGPGMSGCPGTGSFVIPLP